MITTNLPNVRKELDAYKVKLVADVKATRDEMIVTAMDIIKPKISSKRAYTGRGANKKYLKTEAGAPPHKRTGNLFRSIKGKKWSKGTAVYGASVGPNRVFYAHILEHGAKNGSWRHAFMEPSYKEFAPIAESIIAKNLGRTV